jgi:hypothetical protein
MIRDVMRDERGMSTFSLVGLLVCVGILIALAAVLIPAYTGAGGGSTPQTAPAGKAATPIQRAEGVECQTNLTQIRQAITMYHTNNERVPANLEELGTFGVSSSMRHCPVGGTSYPYGYDPQSGRAGCRYPGHERH